MGGFFGGITKGFKKLFGMDESQKQVAPDVYFPSQDPRYQKSQQTLEDIIAKRGYGYTPSMISSNTAPYATARRENLKNYEIPLISSQASARGLGRSTIPVNRAALSGQEAERDIEQRIADMSVRSEDLKANQFQNALGQHQNLISPEVAAQNLARQNAADATNANRATQTQGLQNASIFTTEMAGPALQAAAPFLAMIPGVGPLLAGGAGILGGISSAAGGALKGNKSLVNKSDDELTQLLTDILSGKITN